MTLTKEEILAIFALIEAKHGAGWVKDETVARLQAKLSIMLEVAGRVERAEALLSVLQKQKKSRTRTKGNS